MAARGLARGGAISVFVADLAELAEVAVTVAFTGGGSKKEVAKSAPLCPFANPVATDLGAEAAGWIAAPASAIDVRVARLLEGT